MSTQTTSPLSSTFTCNLCRKTFAANTVPIIGEKPEVRIGKTCQMLAKHLDTEHKQYLIQLALAGEQFKGWAIMEQFSHNDPDIRREADLFRLRFRNISQRVFVPDETIAAQVTRHLPGLSEDDHNKVEALLRGLRDQMEERTAQGSVVPT